MAHLAACLADNPGWRRLRTVAWGVLALALPLFGTAACGLSYEPKSNLEGENAEEVGRNILAEAQTGSTEFALAAEADGWAVRHGSSPDVYDNELYLPAGKNVVLQVTGGKEDVVLELPGFNVRKYVHEGKQTKVWFRARSLGESLMRFRPVRGSAGRVVEGKVIVVPQEEWDQMFR